MNRLELIASRAKEAGLDFLVAGGHAVIGHGHPRVTFDLDLLVRREECEAWLKLVMGLGYTVLHKATNFLQFNATDSEGIPLDLMLVSTETFFELAGHAVQWPGSRQPIRMVSLPHLLALKCHAIKHGSRGRIVKDVDDVIHLLQVNRVDINAPEIRDIFLKHGTPELYEKIQRICKTDAPGRA